MDTLKFVKNFNSDNISLVVTKFFDELMVLYNLVGNRQDLDICTDNTSSSATFVLLTDSDEDAINIYKNLNYRSFEVYNIKYNINMHLSGSSVTTTIIKAAC